MKLDFRKIIQSTCLILIFVGFLLMDMNLKVGATISLTSVGVFALMEKGII